MWKRLLGLAFMAASAAVAACHGFMAEPAARNVVHNSNYCPHCLAAGGPGVTYADGRVWPKSRHGVCGDPHTGPLDHEAGGKFATKKITGVYARGQKVTIKIKITAPHGGRFSFGLCPVPDGATPAAERAAVTQACLDSNPLKNAVDGTPYWWFGKRGVGEYTMDFVLPAAITCKRCVLQWHYETGNSCTIPGTPAAHVMSENMVSCATSNSMEEFWNCADVSIRDGSSPPPSTKPKKKKKRKEAFEVFVGPVDGVRSRLVLLAILAGGAGAAVFLPALLAVLTALAGLAVWTTPYGLGRKRL